MWRKGGGEEGEMKSSGVLMVVELSGERSTLVVSCLVCVEECT